LSVDTTLLKSSFVCDIVLDIDVECTLGVDVGLQAEMVLEVRLWWVLVVAVVDKS